MIVSTSPLRIPRTSRRSLSTAMTLYCSSKIDISASFRECAKELAASPAVKVCSGASFNGLGGGKFPIAMWLGAHGTRMQFTSFFLRCTTSRTRHGKYLFQREFLGFHHYRMQRYTAGKMFNNAHFSVQK